MIQKRVTLVISSLGAGGAERVLTNMANTWAGKGWLVSILTFTGKDEMPFYPLHYLVNHQQLAITKSSRNVIEGAWNNIRRLFVLRHSITDSQPDTVISFMDQTNIITLIALFFTKIPVVVSERSNPQLSIVSSLWKVLRIITYPFATKIVVQTERGRDMMSRWLQRKTIVISNPVYVPLDESTKVSIPNPCVIGVGRLTYEKGFDILIKAFASICEQFPEWQLIIFGDGPLRGPLELMVSDLSLKDKIKFFGYIKTPVSVMKQADLFVLPSRREGFPNALCEAMACGMPVIASDCLTGPREIICDGVNGLLVCPENVSELSRSMERIMSNYALRNKLSENAINIVNTYHPNRIMTIWEELIQ